MPKFEIYPPKEDSFFLSDFVDKKVKKLHPKKILDMGSGTGILAKCAIDSGLDIVNIFVSDINPKSIKILEKDFKNVFLSDLFDKIPKKPKFDLIIFNPPYLPLDKKEPKSSSLSTTGGKKGSEIINKFLINAKDYLKKDGEVLLLISSLTKDVNFSQ